MEENRNHDIDLLELLVQILKFIKLNIVSVIIFTLIGLSYGVFKAFTEKIIFEEHLIVNSGDIDKEYAKGLIDILQKQSTNNLLAKNNDRQINTLVKQIIKINIDTAFSDVFMIKVSTKDTSILREFNKEITNYFNNDKHIIKENISKKTVINNTIEKINTELLDIENLQSLLKNSPCNIGGSVASLYVNAVDLVERKSVLQSALDKCIAVKIQKQNTYIYQNKTNPIKPIFLFTIIGFLVSLLISFFGLIAKRSKV